MRDRSFCSDVSWRYLLPALPSGEHIVWYHVFQYIPECGQFHSSLFAVCLSSREIPSQTNCSVPKCGCSVTVSRPQDGSPHWDSFSVLTLPMGVTHLPPK